MDLERSGDVAASILKFVCERVFKDLTEIVYYKKPCINFQIFKIHACYPYCERKKSLDAVIKFSDVRASFSDIGFQLCKFIYRK